MSRISLAYQDLTDFDTQSLSKKYKKVKELDISNNNLTHLRGIDDFKYLEVLVADQNQLESGCYFPPMPTLHTLSLNGNQIKNLALIVRKLSNLPNLRYLSLLNNEACPNYFNGGTAQSYADYRLYCISRLPTLQFLDSERITPLEVTQAQRRYGSIPDKSTPPAPLHRPIDPDTSSVPAELRGDDSPPVPSRKHRHRRRRRGKKDEEGQVAGKMSSRTQGDGQTGHHRRRAQQQQQQQQQDPGTGGQNPVQSAGEKGDSAPPARAGDGSQAEQQSGTQAQAPARVKLVGLPEVSASAQQSRATTQSTSATTTTRTTPQDNDDDDDDDDDDLSEYMDSSEEDDDGDSDDDDDDDDVPPPPPVDAGTAKARRRATTADDDEYWAEADA